MIRNNLWVWAILLLAVPAAMSQETSETAEPVVEAGVVATVNDEPIYVEDLEQRLSIMHSSMKAPEEGGVERDLDRLMFRLVNDALLAQEARSLELQNRVPDTGASWRRCVRDLAVRRLEYEEIASKAKATDEEAHKLFERGLSQGDAAHPHHLRARGVRSVAGPAPRGRGLRSPRSVRARWTITPGGAG